MADAYRPDLAYTHDVGFGTHARKSAPVLLEALRSSGLESGLVIDLGCGSGILSEAVAAAGYDVLGIDISAAMLELARRRVPTGQFREGSLLTAELPPCVGVAAVGEALNYLFDAGNTKRALSKLFRRVRDALCPGGAFLFDVAGPGRVPDDRRRGFVEGEDWAVLVVQEEKGDRLVRQITSFRKVGELYRRDREEHHLRLLSAAELAEELRGIGFRARVLRGYGELRFGPGLAAVLARRA